MSLLQDERVLSSPEPPACRLERRARNIEHFQYGLFGQCPLEGPSAVDREKEPPRRVSYPMQLLEELLLAQLCQMGEHGDGDDRIKVSARIRQRWCRPTDDTDDIAEVG